jgi:DNA-binding MarR family transcriptional regulator
MQFHNLYLLYRFAKEFGHGQIRKIGVSDTEHLICTFLLGHCDASQDDVADALKLDKATVARALSSLEKKGYVVRTVNAINRRKYVLTLTTSGKETISEVVDVYDAWLSRISSCLTAQEQAQFEDYCARLVTVSEELFKEIEQ